ncbi:28S ribosomal protein S6, mitochondrial-like [Gigantopelta aegis]|uniref:28S ribosomal protein S6, mitochondrial-like n=1 Tax=Gigantopelta aegis TaxID=1735272 RepID=UPI001B88D4B8|nr:28S ribosomal protein S6, mitochondrial-like [Gigantopelta aegis]
MPSYELALIIKALQRPELAQTIRRTCENIMTRGGIIQKMENLGLKTLPYRMVSHGTRNAEGNYILIKFDGRTNSIMSIEDELKRDVDIIKPNIFREEEEFVRPCSKGPCVFGELPNPDHERRVWKRKALKKLRYTKGEQEQLM